MAFLRRFPRSPFWFAGYTMPDGRRVQKSTKQSDRRKAQAIADKWEEAAKLAAQKRLGESQARRILSEIYGQLHGEPLATQTGGRFLTDWAERRKADTKPRTHAAYTQVTREFVASLGVRAEVDISSVTKADVARYRDSVLKRTSVATANKAVKYLRVALKAAWADGLAQDNPAAKLAMLKRTGGVQRRAFKLNELRLILGNAEGEWRGLILFGVYTGQRLRDIATMRWRNIDLHSGEIAFLTQKTGRQMLVPIHPVLAGYLTGLPSTDDPDSPVFPESCALASRAGADSRLSQRFHSILVASGLADSRTKEKSGSGRNSRRSVSPISFHSLRHSTTSLMKNAGVSEPVAMDIIGHDSAAISRHYTHIDSDSKRAAIGRLPDITKL